MGDIIDYRKSDLSLINYDQPEKRDGVYISFMDYNKNPIYIQTPKLEVLNIKNENIELKFGSRGYIFKKLLLELDQKNINITNENQQQWFNKEFPENYIKDNYVSAINDVDDILKCTILQTTFFDKNKTSIDISKVKKGSHLVGIIEVIGLRISKNNIKCIWNLGQAKVYIKKKLIEYSIIDLSDDSGSESKIGEPDYFTDYPSEGSVDSIDSIDSIDSDSEIQGDVVEEFTEGSEFQNEFELEEEEEDIDQDLTNLLRDIEKTTDIENDQESNSDEVKEENKDIKKIQI